MYEGKLCYIFLLRFLLTIRSHENEDISKGRLCLLDILLYSKEKWQK